MMRRLFSFARRKDKAAAQPEAIIVEGAHKVRKGSMRSRVVLTFALFVAIYGVIAGRIIYLGILDIEAGGPPPARPTAARPDIVDRNGLVLATDIKSASLYGEPRRIIDPNEVIEQLRTVLPDLDYQKTYQRLSTDAGFVWLRRQLSPRQQADIMALGIPGIGFRTETSRFYPGGSVASHILGLVNIDNRGIAGMEKYIDDQGLADLQALGMTGPGELKPFRLSIDLRVQHIVHDELTQAMERYQAIAAGGAVLDANTGEVIAMVSLPDYDPNNPVHALDKNRLNRMTAGVFEMGSTFKGFTTAIALDSGLVSLTDSFDATAPIRIGGYTIRDFHGKGRVLTVPEIFIYSSNIGTARMIDVVGIEGHRNYIRRLGLLDPMDTELPEVATPTEPDEWKKIHSITIAFGHGMATTPLQTAVAAGALFNGGKLINPTFLPRTEEEAMASALQVLKPSTSEAMRYLFRYNVEAGSGSRADVPGYFVGGKTGTAEKVVDGRYVSNKRFNAFLAAFPSDDPEYVVLVVIDEPKPEREGIGATAGLNAAPTVGHIIRRSAALLGVEPEFGQERDALLAAYR